MDSENKFWLCAWGMALSFLTGVVVCLTAQAWNKLDKWDKAVSNGVPVENYKAPEQVDLI